MEIVRNEKKGITKKITRYDKNIEFCRIFIATNTAVKKELLPKPQILVEYRSKIKTFLWIKKRVPSFFFFF